MKNRQTKIVISVDTQKSIQIQESHYLRIMLAYVDDIDAQMLCARQEMTSLTDASLPED